VPPARRSIARDERAWRGAALALLVAVSAPAAGAGGVLAPCPASPNCVNSRDPDPQRRVDPIAFTGTPEAARSTLVRTLDGMERARLVVNEPLYLKAQFTSAVFGFVDDVEFVIEPGARLIHLRSASRTGYYDFGVNRRRAEQLRAGFARLQGAGG